MAELQTSHDEILKQLEASDKPSKEEQKKAFQDAFSNLRRVEVMHGEDSKEYAGALTEYMNLKNKIVKEYNLILSQSESAISGMKDPNSFENKPYAQMTVEEAKKALGNLNKKFKDLPTWTYTEMVNKAVGQGFPNCENDVTSQRIARNAQEILIKKIVGENGYNSKVVVGFDQEQWNYVIDISEVERILKDESRTITSGTKESQINSKVIANYLKYLSNSVGGDVTAFQNTFIKNFGEKKSKELVELWNSKSETTAKKELQATSFGSVIESIAKIDINNVGENLKLLTIVSEEDLETFAGRVNKSGFEKLIKIYQSPESQAQDPAACKVIGKFIQLKGLTIYEELLPSNEFWNKKFGELIKIIGIEDSTKIALLEQELKSILAFSNSTLDGTKVQKKVNEALTKILGKEKKIIPSLSLEIVKFLRLINAFELKKKSTESQDKVNKTKGVEARNFEETFALADANAAEQAAERYNNYFEFKKVFDDLTPILTKKVDSLTPDIINTISDPTLEEEPLSKYIGELGIDALIQILPQLGKTKIRYDMIDRDIRSSTDCVKIIELFPKNFSVTDIESFNSFALFEDPKKNGCSRLNKQAIKNIFSKTALPLKKSLVKNIYTLADDGVKLNIIKSLIDDGKIDIHDIPLDILKFDENGILGFSITQKETFLKFGDTPNINKNIQDLLSGDETVISRSFADRKNSYVTLGGINDYIEKYGIKDIQYDLIEKMVQKKGIGFFPSLIWIAKEDKNFAEKIMNIDAQIVLYLNLRKWPDRNFTNAFLNGIKNLSLPNQQKAIDAYIFTSIKDIIDVYNGLGSEEKTLFLSSAVQKNIARCFEASQKENISDLDLQKLQSISKIIKSFNNQTETIDRYVVDRYSKINTKGREIFEEKVMGVIKKYNIEGPQGKELLEILKNKDWFKARIADVIKIFQSNPEIFEKFVKEITQIEIEIEQKKLDEVTALKKQKNKPIGRVGDFYTEDRDGEWKINHTKLKEGYYSFLALKSKEKKDNETPQDFNQRILKEFIASLGNNVDTSDFEEIIKTSQTIEEKIYINTNTPESIQAAVEGRFDTLYGTYIQRTYSLPASVVPGLQNRVVGTVKNEILPVQESGGNSYLISPTLGRIPLSSDEAKTIKNNPEAQEKLITAYDFICNTLKLEKIWNYRDTIIDAAKNVSTSFIDFNKGNEFWSPESLQKFMVLVGKSVGTFKEPVSSLTGKPFDEIKQKLLLQNGATITKGGVEDTNGRGEIEKTFLSKFDPNRDCSKTQYLLEQAFKEGQLNS